MISIGRRIPAMMLIRCVAVKVVQYVGDMAPELNHFTLEVREIESLVSINEWVINPLLSFSIRMFCVLTTRKSSL